MIDYIRRAEETIWGGNDLLRQTLDKAAENMGKAIETQHGIIKYMEGMAQVLAQAGLASSKATGDSPGVAVDRWIHVIRKRAWELIREATETNKQAEPKQEAHFATPEEIKRITKAED